MEISDLLGKLKGTDKDKPKPFLALELTDEIVVAAVWQVENGQTSIVSIGTPIEWDGDKEDTDELVRAADASVSNAIEGLEQEPSQIIFGVAPSWAGEEGILPGKITLIKKICKELELKPLGFVVITDSLLRYLKMQEGIPANSIFVHVARDTVTVTLVRMGKIDAIESMGRGDDLASDVVEGLSRFAGTAELPSRILVYDGMHNIEEEVQNLLSYDWKGTFNFLHIPKIENLPKDVVIRSIAVAGGAEVAKAIGFDITEPVASPTLPKETDISPNDNVVPVDDVIDGFASSETEEEDEDDVENDGENEDDEGTEEDSNVKNVTQEDEELLSASDFGFASTRSAPLEMQLPHKKLPPPPTRVSLLDDEPPSNQDVPSVLRTSSPKVSRPTIKVPKLSLPHIKLPRISIPSIGKLGLIGAIILVLGIVAAVGAIWAVPKATVTVFVEPKTLPETATITLDTTADAVDITNVIVPAVPVEKIVEGSDTVPASGKKTIGDPAQGEVTIYNRTSLNKSFKAGTVLTAKSLKFTIDSDVTVASKSAGADYVDVPGKATAKISAKVIGADSNLGADTEFIIENFAKDSYVAKNSSALSGGSSREVQVVDKSDKATLTKNLLSKLKDQGKAELMSEIGGNNKVYVLEKGSTIEQEDYSTEVGTEATELTGTMSVKVKGVSYDPQDVEKVMATALTKAIPSGYERTGVTPSVEFGELKSESDKAVEILATINVQVLPQVNTATVQETLRGLRPDDVEGALTSVIGLKGAQVTITPKWLDARFKWMPRNPASITVDVVPAL